MTAADVVDVYFSAEACGVDMWIDGGWAVDALLGRQTRPHSDLDVAMEEAHAVRLRAFLAGRGYRDVPRDDTTRWNFVLGDGHGREVDVHAFVLGADGTVVDGIGYPPGSLTGTGTIAGRTIRCVAAEHLVRFHTGYPLRDKDWLDVTALCERFGIEYPQEYRRQGSAGDT